MPGLAVRAQGMNLAGPEMYAGSVISFGLDQGLEHPIPV